MSGNLASQNTTQEISFFNRFVSDREYDSLTPYGYGSLIHAFEQYLGRQKIGINYAVDLGCGTGSFTRRFLDPKDTLVLGVDIALGVIRRANDKTDGIKYLVSDINKLGLRSGSMDLVVFSGVLHHFPRPQEALKEAYRILKKGGLVLSYDPHINNPCMWLYRHPASLFYSKLGKTDNEQLLGKQQMQGCFAEAGFGDVEIRAISGVTISYLESRTARIFLPFYNIVEYLLGLTPLANTFGSFLICGARKE